jgi:hypothetical protein
MKKHFLLLLAFIILSVSCSHSENKTRKPQAVSKKEKALFEITKAQIKWTAYKTTEKTAVPGTFNEIEWKNFKPAVAPGLCLRNVSFRMKTASIFTGKPERDKTLYEYLFAKMLEGNYIEGRVAAVDTAKKYVKVAIRMNGVEKLLDFPYSVNDSTVHAAINIDLEKDFMAGEALYFLHTACKEQHTGKDGISKTWPDVKLEADFYYNKETDSHAKQ